MITRVQKHREIFRELHTSFIRRTEKMIKRVFSKEGIVLIGGVAKNQCMLTILNEQLDLRILITDDT